MTTNQAVRCRHCPAIIEQTDGGLWMDQHGFVRCVKASPLRRTGDRVVSDHPGLNHEPMPAVR